MHETITESLSYCPSLCLTKNIRKIGLTGLLVDINNTCSSILPHIMEGNSIVLLLQGRSRYGSIGDHRLVVTPDVRRTIQLQSLVRGPAKQGFPHKINRMMQYYISLVTLYHYILIKILTDGVPFCECPTHFFVFCFCFLDVRTMIQFVDSFQRIQHYSCSHRRRGAMQRCCRYGTVKASNRCFFYFSCSSRAYSISTTSHATKSGWPPILP